jgi:N-acetylmuramoyl-L-alanine amidase
MPSFDRSRRARVARVRRGVRVALLTLTVVAVALPAAAQGASSARAGYERLMDRERALADGSASPAAAEVRRLIDAYVHFSGRFARTGYADNALWQAARLAADLHARTERAADRATAMRLFRHLIEGYPSSSLVANARSALTELENPPASAPPRSAEPPASAPAAAVSETGRGDPTGLASLRGIERTLLPELVRVTFDLAREVEYHDERLDGPPRVYFDLLETVAVPDLADAVLTYPDDVVRQIRVGPRPGEATRVVLDLAGADRYSVFTLYNPFRLVVDVYRAEDVAPGASASAAAPAVPPSGTPAAASPAAPPVAPPGPPAANTSGSFSMSRQLGLGVSRIVIDPGHGGRDPGALGKTISEAALVLDVALRLERLLLGNPAFEVVLTRRSDVFVDLEERTAIANRARADLFLSIHANASRNVRARGVETYVLNFASNPTDAEVAARENAASARSMHQLGDMVRAITLNNKLNESLEFAAIVQDALVRRLRGSDSAVRDLGVKQAPFVVLIGAGMPSVLAEISFLSNPKDAQLLATASHRQAIAESLHGAIVSYQRTLKATETVASQ